MAPIGTATQNNVATKAKRPVPPGIQTNGGPSSTSSPSPLLSAKKPPPNAMQPPNSASDRSITASTVRPVNRARRETSSQIQGRNSRSSAGLRAQSISHENGTHDDGPIPYAVTPTYILKKYAGRPPSLVVHLHQNHFRFDGQDSVFQYKSPMKLFLDHVKARTIPHDLLEYFVQAGVPFYDGCLIVQLHDHKSVVQPKDVSKPTSTANTVVASSIHNHNQWLTPSPFVPFPKEELQGGDGTTKVEEEPVEKTPEEKDKKSMPAPSLPTAESQKTKGVPKPKTMTAVLLPTPESLHVDLMIKAATPKASADARAINDASSLVPPSTPLTTVPPTPTVGGMLPPAKRQKKEKMELDGSNMHAAEGQILLATNAPLFLEPTNSVEATIALLGALAHPSHNEAPPQPKMRKRTVAEMAADEASAAKHERYMLYLDDRLAGASGGQGASGADGDGQTGASTFEPRFERFKVIEDIKREHAEKKEQEKIKQAEADRRLQQQRQQQQQQQQQQQEHLLATQRLEAAERAKREAAAAALRENQQRQAEAHRQAAMAARAASTPTAQNNNAAAAAVATPNTPVNGINNAVPNIPPSQHVHAVQNGVVATGMPISAPTPIPNGMPNQPQPRFPPQMSQPTASSPVIRQGTPQNMSSPMVGSVPMQQTTSGMAASPPRPSSVVQNPPMSVPMAHTMSARGSQQSHPSGTPRIPHSTPHMAHGTPINRQAMSATPRMTQASPPPNMMAQNSQMGAAGMMMNNQGMAQQHNPQVIAHMAAQQRAIAQQQQMAAMQNGGVNMNMNGQGMTPQQQQAQVMQLMQRQMMMQQQQQGGGMLNQQQQQQFAQQYAQQLQNLQASQMRTMTPQMQAQLQQMARMGQMGGQMGNPMQRQVSGQMMGGNNANMQQAMVQLQLQQQQQQQQQQQRNAQQQQQQQQMQQQQQQQQQHSPQQQQQQQQQMQGNSAVQMQIQSTARQIFNKMVAANAAKIGGAEHLTQDAMEKMKMASFAQAQQHISNIMNQRRMQQHQQQQQLMAQQQQQQQQQAAMQNMGGMMGPQGM
jgi:transcription factor SPT20